MPIIVNPGFVLPPDVDPVVSEDGRLTVVVDPVHAGVLLRADYSDDPSVMKVRFEREGVPVRSGDPAWAPGGWAHAYDHEAPLGVGALWRAVPILFDGSEGDPSAFVGAMVPALVDGFVWLKPVADPSAGMRVRIQPMDFRYVSSASQTQVAGSRFPAASWDVLQAHTSEIRLRVTDAVTERRLLGLLDMGPVLAQFPQCAGVEDFYFLPDDVQVEEQHWDGYPQRLYSIGTFTVDRPATVGSPLMIPGLSYDTVAAGFDSYDQLASQVSSYNALLKG